MSSFGFKIDFAATSKLEYNKKMSIVIAQFLNWKNTCL